MIALASLCVPSLVAALFGFLVAPASADSISLAPAHQVHTYTTYERLILKNASAFHKNLSAHQFAKKWPSGCGGSSLVSKR